MSKSKVITIDPVTRLEGHGKVTIHLDDNGDVAETRFHVTQLRGFEKFCQGREFWEMPVITSRVCGICSVSHNLASAKAGDAILGVKIPRTAELLRRLMHMGQYIHSHALHFFYLAAPDFLMGMDSEPATRNVVGLIGAAPEIATMAVKIRAYGQRMIAKAGGGRKVHPIGAIPGGVSSRLLPEDRDELLKEIDEVIEGFQQAIAIFKDYGSKNAELVEKFANFPSGYMGLVDKGGKVDLYDGTIRLKGDDGKVLEDGVAPADYLSIIEEKVEDWSYLKFPYYKKMGIDDGIYRVGPLARLNVADGIGTPVAGKEFENFKSLAGSGVVHQSLYYHYTRLIEAVYAAEEAKRLLQDRDICGEEIRALSGDYNEEGVGIIEAPRGTLIHHYGIDKSGRMAKVNLVVATGHNNLGMNRSVAEVAKEFIKKGNVTEGLLNRVEVAIRCYDPCLSCATHTMDKGSAPLVSIYKSDGSLLTEL